MADNNGLVPTQEKKKGFFYVLTHWREILAKDLALFGREQSVAEKEVTEKERAVLSREQQVNSKANNNYRNGSYPSEQISKAIKQNLTEFGYADPESIKKRGFEKVADADTQIKSLDTDEGR